MRLYRNFYLISINLELRGTEKPPPVVYDMLDIIGIWLIILVIAYC